jgi:hypothetical protein
VLLAVCVLLFAPTASLSPPPPPTGQAAAAPDAARALLAILRGFRKSGSYGRLKSTWRAATDVCRWTGVQCTDGQVTHLDLSYMSLEGTLAAEIGDLTQLMSLTLNGNRLSSTLPHDIGRLAALQSLSAHGNEFSLPLPASISSCRKLQVLRLPSCFLRGVSSYMWPAASARCIRAQIVGGCTRRRSRRLYTALSSYTLSNCIAIVSMARCHPRYVGCGTYKFSTWQ